MLFFSFARLIFPFLFFLYDDRKTINLLTNQLSSWKNESLLFPFLLSFFLYKKTIMSRESFSIISFIFPLFPFFFDERDGWLMKSLSVSGSASADFSTKRLHQRKGKGKMRSHFVSFFSFFFTGFLLVDQLILFNLLFHFHLNLS